jgi:Glycosyltransferase family 87
MSKIKSTVWFLACLTTAVFFGAYVFRHPMDFRVYYYAARGVFDGTRPVYGLTSGLGWPMHYRYPPLFLLTFAPFAMLPLGWGATIWLFLKFIALVVLLRMALRRGLAAITLPYGIASLRSALVPFLFIAPYLVEEFRYGNAQFFVFALSAAALLFADEWPFLSSAGLALAISIKVWPLFFLPYLAARRNWKAVSYTTVFVVVLALLPGLYFGFGGNLRLLTEWFSQETHTQLSENEIWFPNQSLRGVLMRYLTVIDYSQVPDSNYAQVNILSLDPPLVRQIWVGLSAAAYAGFLWLAHRRRYMPDFTGQGLAFCLVAVLEPFTQKYALAILLWPAVILASVTWKPRWRFLLYAATILALVQPLTPGATAQRLLQVLGLDFAAAALVTVVLAGACLELPETTHVAAQDEDLMSV